MCVLRNGHALRATRMHKTFASANGVVPVECWFGEPAQGLLEPTEVLAYVATKLPPLESCSPGNSGVHGNAPSLHSSMTGNNCVAFIFWGIAMKTIASALITLSVLAGVAAPASAFDARSLYEQLDRLSR